MEERLRTTSGQLIPESKDEAVLGLFTRTVEASFLFGAVLFVIGWSYLDGYYSAFSLKVGQLGISHEEAILASFKFIFQNSSKFLVLGLLLFLVIAVGWLYGLIVAKPWREVVVWIALAGFLFVSWRFSRKAFEAGREAARVDMIAGSSLLPVVEIEIDHASVSDNIVDYRELETKHYRLLLQTESGVWLFKPANLTKESFPLISVVALPKSVVRVMTIERPIPREVAQ